MKFAPLIILFFLMAACQTLPVIKEPTAPEKTNLACPFPFLREQTTLIHAIEVQVGQSTKSAIIGITSADPATREISCAIMTAEGMVLFEARESAGALEVSRALPPFDAPAFAQNMMNDIKLTFLPPEGTLQKAGFLGTGERICRWRDQNSAVIDVLETDKGRAEIKRYTTCGKLKRRITFGGKAGDYHRHIELHAWELANYSLLMHLIEVQAAYPRDKNPQGEK